MDARKNMFDVDTIRTKLPPGTFYVLRNGKKVQDLGTLEPNGIYHVVPRVLGGKGGAPILLISAVVFINYMFLILGYSNVFINYMFFVLGYSNVFINSPNESIREPLVFV